MIVVFDTNIWKQHLYTGSAAAAAVRFYIGKTGNQVALPEVVRLEVEHHFRNDVHKLVAELKSKHEQLLRLFGTLKELVLPDEGAIASKTASVIDLGIPTQQIPFSFESARASFMKIVEKRPPSSATQQFKDGVIWADCLTLAKSDDVFLVTEDGDFYEKDKTTPSRFLMEEVAQSGGKRIRIGRLEDLLEEIKSDIEISEEKLVTATLARVRTGVDRLLEDAGFVIGEPVSTEAKLFLTEDPKRLFVEYRTTLRCLDATGAGRAPGTLELRGDGFYVVGSDTLTLDPLGETLTVPELDGTERVRSNVVLRAEGITLGHREIQHRLRKPL